MEKQNKTKTTKKTHAAHDTQAHPQKEMAGENDELAALYQILLML